MMQHVPEGHVWDLDRSLLLWINGDWGGGWDAFWWTVSQPWSWVPLYILVIWLMWRRMGWRRTLLALGLVVLGVALADQTANFFKSHTPKFRPTHTTLMWEGSPFAELIHTVRNLFNGEVYEGGRFGTVSGHAATSMTIGLTAAGIYRRRWLSIVMGLYVALTCFSRMYLGVHFPLDIVFGLAAGTLIGLLMLWLWRLSTSPCPACK